MTNLARRARSPRLAIGAAAVALCVHAPAAGAQMPGLPVLQNAFSNPGITAAANYGSGGDATTYGVAGAWAPRSGRWQFSAGVGAFEPDGGDRATALGGRVAAALFSFAGGSIGVAPFAGIGGASLAGGRLTHLPAGVGIGYRRALGATRAISLHAAPFYSWSRSTVTVGEDESSLSKGLFRVSAGVDVTLFGNFGATAGLEGGQNADPGDPGATGTVWGVALSYAFH